MKNKNLNLSQMTKKGQAAGAAILLVIIAGLLIGFIILIPPQDRAELLGENIQSDTGTENFNEDVVLEENLLKEFPGRIDFLSQKEIEHPLPEINIYTRTESKSLEERRKVYLKKGIFSEEQVTLKFNTPDIENTHNVILAFNVNKINGKLKIKLNGEEVFDLELMQGNAQPLYIPSSWLMKNNELVFSLSSPGLSFWSTNEAILENIKVVADITSTELQSSRNIFLVSETEKSNLERTFLKFQPTCNINEVKKLLIKINEKEVYNNLPDCDLEMIPIEFSSELLNQGENKIVFSTEKGSYILSHVVIKSKLKNLIYPTYYFELTNEQYRTMRDGKLRVRLNIDFVDLITTKYGDITFNGHIKQFDTKEQSLAVDLSDDIVLGNNALQIRPKKTLDIRELRVDIVK